MSTLIEIEQQTRRYADAHDALATIIGQVNEEIEVIKRMRLAVIKRAVAKAADQHDQLAALLENSKDLFIKPRTMIFHGVKIGFRKGKGGIEFDDAQRVVELIEKHFAERTDELIRVKKTPDKKALEDLSVAELKKIGCTAEDTGDVVVIKPADSEVEKIVAALLKGATAEVESEAAA